MKATKALWILLAVMVLGLVLLTAGGLEKKEGTAGEAAEKAEACESVDVFTPRDLLPVLSESGPMGSLPDSVTISFARAIVGRGKIGKQVEKETVLVLDPPMEGRLEHASESTLRFTPEEPFAPSSTYTVTLKTVATKRGVVRAPADRPWSHSFTTGTFRFQRMSLRKTYFSKGMAEVRLLFSAPVRPEDVRGRASFRLVDRNGKGYAVTNVTFEKGSSPNGAVALLRSGRIASGMRITMRLDSGVPMRGQSEIRAGEAEADVLLVKGPSVTIHEAVPVEGTNGFYVEVVGDDSSVKEKKYYYGRGYRRWYGRKSIRCLLKEEDALEGIHFEPPVTFTVSRSSGGIRIFGDFERGSYAMRIDAGVRTVDGGMLHGDYETTFTVPARKQNVQFVAKGRYLPRSAWRNLNVRHMNLTSFELRVRHVPERNLVYWMSDDYTESTSQRTSDLILKERIAVEGGIDRWSTTAVDVGALVPASTKGLLEITASTEKAASTVRILLTDLHLIAKRFGSDPEKPEEGGIHVWAVDMESLRPVEGARIEWVKKSGTVVASGLTGAGGGCLLRHPAKGIDEVEPFALVARKGGDLTYLRFKDLKAEVQEERIAGEPYRQKGRYRAALYSDRGVYRPGETAHLVSIVRNEENLAPKEGMPLVLKIIDPRGKDLKRRVLPVNDAGVASLDVSFAAFAATGRYEVRAEAGDRLIGKYGFQVEEFVPERMEVKAAPRSSDSILGDDVAVDVSARYFFGGIPAGHDVEVSCELHPSVFKPKQNAQYEYGVWREDGKRPLSHSLGSVTGTLDGEGKATITCPTTGRAGGFKGACEMTVRAAVFEAGGGRTTVGRTSVRIHPERFYIGLGAKQQKLASGDTASVEGAVVDWEGNPVADVKEVTLTFIHLESEYGWYYDESIGREIYKRYLRAVPDRSIPVAVSGGTFKADMQVQASAVSYLVRAEAGKARTDLELEGGGDWYYWWPYESQADQTPRPGRPTWIELEAPKTIRVGDRVEVSFEAPYAGRVLLTAETDRVLEDKWKSVKAGPVEWSFRLKDFQPNVYVTAFLIKDPHLDSKEAFLPDRAFGVRSMKVVPTRYTQEIAMEVPDTVRSRERLDIRLDLGKRKEATYATVAAVDEGILSLTDFESPDPLSIIFAQRALGVTTFETVGWSILMPSGGPSGATGGGGMKRDRIQAIQPVALWSGLVKVPEDGRATVSFDLPQYSGALRIMAVTADERRVGTASKRVTVKDPLVVQATVPRFAVRGDRFSVPVFVTNVSGKKRNVKVTIDSETLEGTGVAESKKGPPVEIAGEETSTLTLADGEGGSVTFDLKAGGGLGGAVIRISVESGEIRSQEESVIPVLPAGPKNRRVQRIELAAGTLDLTQYLEGWEPLTERTTVWVTGNPYGESFDHLKYLIRYPYGCIEQTTSTTRPLLYVSKLLHHVDPELVRRGKIDEMISLGIDRILSMQTSEGGFSYWPGGTEPSYWGTAYATHLLLDAKRMRHPVSQIAIDQALDWMEDRISNYYERGNRDRSWYTANAEPYMHYVLSLAGRARKARIRRLIEQIQPTSGREKREHLYMLEAALYKAGDHRYERQLRNPDVSPLTDYRDNGWSFYSDRRMRGFMLSTFLDLFGKTGKAEELADLVAEGLRAYPSRWYTTQELVWCTTGLGKFVEAGAKEFEPAVLKGEGRILNPEPVPEGMRGSDRSWNVTRAGEYETLMLEVPPWEEGKLYCILSSEGVRTKPDYRVGGEGLKVERRFLDASGASLNLRDGSHALGQVVHVELTVTNTSGERIANIALVDRIPAGWEIENPRLGRGDAASETDKDRLWFVDHMDLRDDRIELFGHLDRGESKVFVYGVRAVTAGRFTIPSVEAEAMYDPRKWAREGSAAVEIAAPW